MAAALPADLKAVFDRFITTEYVTIDGRGQPIAWPVTPYPHEVDGQTCVDITTGLGYPKKARDAQRNPKVALLFSEPNGSGLEDPPFVLVQGSARVDEDDLAANRERYRREGRAKLPKANEKAPPPSLDRFMSWYVDRIYVHVVPQRITVWHDGDTTAAPEVSGSLPAGEAPAAPAPAGEAIWDERIEQLGSTYATAVLAIVGPDGFPYACRVPVRADRAAGVVRIEEAPAGIPLAPGRACITAHAHSPDFLWQRNFQVRGDLIDEAGGWALRPRKLVGGFEIPETPLAVLRENFRKIMRYRKIAKAELKKRQAA